MRYVQFFVATGLQVGAVVLGFYWGIGKDYVGRPPSIYTALAEIAGLFMFAGIILSLVTKTVPGVTYLTWVCIGTLGYSIIVVLLEPFLFAHNNQVYAAPLLLAPQLLTIPYLVRAGRWVSVVGVTLFVFTSSAMIATNSYYIYSSSGFFKWIEIRE